ncbi:MAG: response regulator [Oligoflexia bacterium]|nr:response regulator [Oligoflexia bacterium]
MEKAAYNILIIEDNATIREVLKMGLELEGFSVSEAGDGAEALAALEQSPRPNLILLDLLMPKMNGTEFVERIKKDPSNPNAKIPIVVISAVANSAREKPLQVQEVLPKPLDFNELFGVVRRFCPAP